MNRQEALKLLDEWVTSRNLRKHMLAVAASMEFYAQYFARTDAELTQTNAERELPYKDLTYKIRGIIFDVKKLIGLGHKEIIYQNALEERFIASGIPFKKEASIDIRLGDKKLGVYRPDFIIDDKIIVEIKALPFIGDIERRQAWTYLRGSSYRLALLINFGPTDVEIVRIIFDTARDYPRESAFDPRKLAALKERWWVVGLLHDMDYEKYPNPNRDETGLASLDASRSGHPYKAIEFLSDKLDKESLDAILGHAEFTHTPRVSQMAKTLFAVDELTGMITAVALIKPEKKLSAVNVESVKKRFKEKRFAAGVNRGEIIQGAADLGISLDEHIQNVIDAMENVSNELGL